MENEKFLGKTGVLFATGPSLTNDVVEAVRPYHEDGKLIAFGCNDSYRVVDYLDIFYACDGTWWDYHIKSMKFFEVCTAKELWTQEKRIAEKYPNINHIFGTHEKGLNVEGRKIHFGSNSGYQQLNLAYLMGIRKFILLGYNMGAGGNTHFFGEHPRGLNRTSPYDRFIKCFETIQEDIKKNIINCTEPTALNTFRKKDLKEVLETL